MEKPPSDRRGVPIIVALILCVVSVPLVIHLSLRGSNDTDTASGKEDDWEWKSAEDNLFSIEDLALDRRAEVQDIPEPAVPAAVPPRAAPPEPPTPLPDTATATAERVKRPPKKAKPPSPTKVEVTKPAKTDGENRYFTLELSGKLGSAKIGPEDAQTWARLSYFVRQEARRPHFLVYPDGSVPLSVPQKANGKPVSRRANDDIEPGGDPDEPAYRIVIQAAADQGQGVTFFNQRLASTFRCQVNCRIDRRVGDSWKAIGRTSAEESFNPPDSDARTADYLRQVYDASIEKLIEQLAGQPPFARAPPTK